MLCFYFSTWFVECGEISAVFLYTISPLMSTNEAAEWISFTKACFLDFFGNGRSTKRLLRYAFCVCGYFHGVTSL